MGFKTGDQYAKSKFYVGLADCKVVAINPTKDDLVAHGINVKEEIVYTSLDDKGNRKVRLDFWLQLKNNALISLKFFLTEKESVATTGSFEWINDFGVSTYAKSIEDIAARKLDWFDLASIRKAYDGEVMLIDFIKNWLCVPRDVPSTIDSWKELFAGNVEELRGYMKIANEQKEPYLVQVLLYINDKGYQAVYSRFFAKGNSTNKTRWVKHFDSLTNNPLGLGKDFTFRELEGMEPDVTKPEESATEEKPKSKGWA